MVSYLILNPILSTIRYRQCRAINEPSTGIIRTLLNRLRIIGCWTVCMLMIFRCRNSCWQLLFVVSFASLLLSRSAVRNGSWIQVGQSSSAHRYPTSEQPSRTLGIAQLPPTRCVQLFRCAVLFHMRLICACFYFLLFVLVPFGLEID